MPALIDTLSYLSFDILLNYVTMNVYCMVYFDNTPPQVHVHDAAISQRHSDTSYNDVTPDAP